MSDLDFDDSLDFEQLMKEIKEEEVKERIAFEKAKKKRWFE